MLGEFPQAVGALGTVDQAAQVGDQGRLAFGQRRLVGPATPARAKTGPLGIRRRRAYELALELRG